MLKEAIIFVCTLSLPLFAADRVKVDSASKWNKDQIEVTFKVASLDALKLNFDAPWQLKLGDKSSDLFEKTSFGKADFKSEVPGFVFHSKKISNKQSPKSLPYELTAYSCTSDKSQCFRDVLKGQLSIQTK